VLKYPVVGVFITPRAEGGFRSAAIAGERSLNSAGERSYGKSDFSEVLRFVARLQHA